jgi:CRISPR-associated endonuclease Cas1
MAATQTVPPALHLSKSDDSLPQEVEHPFLSRSELKPRRGVIVLYGYGSNVRVERGHLVIEDGIGSERYYARLPRVNHGLERLVVIGSDGAVSFSALRWLADQNASFVMLERNGTVLATTGPVKPSDIRLRRAQALAHQSNTAFRISRELIDQKLAGQEQVARDSLRDQQASTAIREIRSELAEVESIDAILNVEARAARIYWKTWKDIQILFPTKELARVPDHWRSFESRASVLSGSPRLAVNPLNAILNYLYALLESECRLAISALGLDPEMEVFHKDTVNRASLACDLMEAIRPLVDEYVLGWIMKQPLKRSWFFEERNGNCRLSSDLATQLAETSSTWRRRVVPVAEWIVKEIAGTVKARKLSSPATRLTPNHKREAKGAKPISFDERSAEITKVCVVCGEQLVNQTKMCKSCGIKCSTKHLIKAALKGRVAAHTPEAESKRSKTQLAKQRDLRKWSESDQPSWLTLEFYLEKIQPEIRLLSNGAIERGLNVSRGYAIEIKRGRTPHPRHWAILATLIGVNK